MQNRLSYFLSDFLRRERICSISLLVTYLPTCKLGFPIDLSLVNLFEKFSWIFSKSNSSAVGGEKAKTIRIHAQNLFNISIFLVKTRVTHTSALRPSQREKIHY